MNLPRYTDAVVAIALAKSAQDIRFSVPYRGWELVERVELTRRLLARWHQLTGSFLTHEQAEAIVKRGSYDW